MPSQAENYLFSISHWTSGRYHPEFSKAQLKGPPSNGPKGLKKLQNKLSFQLLMSRLLPHDDDEVSPPRWVLPQLYMYVCMYMYLLMLHASAKDYSCHPPNLTHWRMVCIQP